MSGACILADYPDVMVRIACRECDRRGQYQRSNLMALYGEMLPLPDVLGQLVHDCPKRGGIGNDSCGVYFPDLVERLMRPKGRWNTTDPTAREWFETWRATREFCEATRHSLDLIPWEKAIPQYLRDAYVAGALAWIWNKHSRCEVRLVPKSERFPDAQLRIDGAICDFEVTMADKRDRRMFAEHREAKRGKSPPVEGRKVRQENAREAIPRVCREKVRRYLGAPRSNRSVLANLLIYVNLGPVLSADVMVELTKRWRHNFASIWLLCGADAVRAWPTLTVLRAKAPAPLWTPQQ